MMNDALCTYDGRRDEVLVAYVYDDIDPLEREAFERHVAGCLPCRTELEAFGDVREGLAAWAAPEVADGVGGKTPRVALRLAEPPAKPSGWRTFAGAPIWLQAAAAMLVVAASLGLANINLTYSREGLTLTTGWMRAPAATVAADGRAAVPAQPASAAATENAQFRADLIALQRQMQDLASHAAASTPAEGDALLKQVRTDLQASERRQMREFDLRLAEVAREFHVQRQADLVKIDRTLGVFQNRTGMEVMRQQQQLNNLLQRVSQER